MNDILKILLTGFEKFGDEKINPSELIVKKMSKKKIEGCYIDTLILPVSYEKSIKILEDYLGNNNVDIAIHLGQGGGRAVVNIERIAVNIMDSTQPDNDERVVQDQKILSNGEDAYATKIDVKKIAQFLNEKKIPANVSYTAGQYICNEVYYFSLYKSFQNSNPKHALFAHLPFLPEQVAEKYPKNSDIPSMNLQLQFKAVQEIIKNMKKFLTE